MGFCKSVPVTVWPPRLTALIRLDLSGFLTCSTLVVFEDLQGSWPVLSLCFPSFQLLHCSLSLGIRAAIVLDGP
jgi:hypothetical protein